ncbi:MAG: Ig domain-containing protein, partial [Clostridia bacterium]|nr:Ig domain-containing protein [Clostridia bacterium]
MCCVNSIKVYPTALELGVGSWYYDAYAEVCPTDACCKCVEWHSDNPCVASVNPSNGYIYANSVGVAKIYATTTDGSGCSNYINIRVSETVPVRSIVVLPATITIEPGQTTTLSTTVLPKTASNKALIWTSSNEKVAIVDCNGVVTGIAGGTVSIIATAADGSGTSDACVVKVTGDVLVSSITFYHSSVNMLVGDSRYLWINVLPSDATNDSVCWSSSDTSVVTVNKNSGLVLAQGAGTATIYATACDGSGVVGTCTITVRDKIFVSSITVSPKTKKLNVNASATLSATVLPDNADDKRIRWSCEPSGIVSLNDVTGEIRGIGTGTTTVKAVACDGSGTCGSCKVTVVTVPVT